MAIVKKYPAEVVSVTSFEGGIHTITMRSLEKPFRYAPGQFLHFALDEYDPSGQWPDSRCFSMQSSPAEENIRITYAVKGKFTGRMQAELHPGKPVTLKLPYGDLFTREHSKIQTVFIAGGTGITPFLSLFTDPSFASYERPVIYAGFRNSGMNLYHDEFQTADRMNPKLVIHTQYEDAEGLLNIENILHQSPATSAFFISGPPQMISSFREYLKRQGIMDDQIRTDDWE